MILNKNFEETMEIVDYSARNRFFKYYINDVKNLPSAFNL